MINDSYTEIKNLKHDLKNQVSVLNDLIGNERFEEAKVYMGRLYKDVEQTTSVCYTGNPVVDSIINLKGDYAKSRGINFITKINTNTIEFDAIALCRILGNALDNSIEACEQVENGEKYIYIAINQINNKLIIEIENTSLPVDVSNLTTTKADKKLHGIGMQSIKQSAESMNGCVSCNYENGYFSIKIILTE
ncbi:MAG: ATP-binding protein [Ruminococcus sp.]|nr:ATP-binding protein [Ruminococcus sp.]